MIDRFSFQSEVCVHSLAAFLHFHPNFPGWWVAGKQAANKYHRRNVINTLLYHMRIA